MKSIKLSLVLICFSLFVAGSAQATYILKISGNVIYRGSYNGYVWGANVKICTSATGSGNCAGSVTNMQGYYEVRNWSVPDGATVYFFTWADHGNGGPPEYRTGMWGSTTIPISSWRACSTGTCAGLSNSLILYPAPLTPVAVNPAPHATNVGLQQTLKWKSASDSWRKYAGIVYDIYGSGYGAPLLLQISNLPCNPDVSGNCQWTLPITLDPQTPYNWKIVAKAQNYYGFRTESLVYHFMTGYGY